MEFFNFSLDGETLRIEGFPDADAVVALYASGEHILSPC
jgi:hypothetical protein